MTVRKLKYILFTLAPLSAMLMTGCLDEPLADTDCFDNPDVISFTAVTGSGAASTRAGEEKQLYEPLVLTDDATSQTLYLHTYDSERIGFEPGDDVTSGETDGAQTRGNQIVTADDLIKFHKDFMVHAQFKENGVEYIEWSKTQVSSANNFWRTEKTRYWPGERELSFMAVSPTAEFNSLNNKVFSDQQATFTYTAKKQGNNRDAEAQTDLLLAAGTCNKPTSVNGRAPLKFHHALSAIKFAVRDVLDGEVVNVQIAGVHSSGNCVYTALSDGEGSFTWSGQTGSETYSQNFNYAINGRPAGGIDPGDDSQDILLNDAMPEKTFMLIPQRIPDNAEIIVTLKRTNPGKDEDGNQLPETITVRGKIKANDVQEWLPGHEYVYTISTSKDNWVYVFNARGNQANGYNNIYVYSPNAQEFDTYQNTAYYSVQSYRYRANNQTVVEACPWKASHDGSLSYNVTGGGEAAYPSANPQQKWVAASTWITDKFATPLSGKGNANRSFEQHDLNFLAHYVATDWIGDENMQGYKPYEGYTKEKPYDLSKPGGMARNTANCYVVDRGGWYMFPLVYGNAIKNGATNSSAYECQNKSTDANLQLLSSLIDYKNRTISSPNITAPSIARAELVWEDAYNLVDNLELVTINGEKMIRFYIDPNIIQQGNAVIALTDGSIAQDGKSPVIWSWHIWATEHWIDKTTRKPHAFDTNNTTFNTYKSSDAKTENGMVIGLRQCGDVAVTYNQKGRSFMMAAYNLGWCDPKKVLYLKRKGTMDFVQYRPGSTVKTGKTAKLPIIQEGETIDYKYANNVYYQWGRKDPIRGFFNHEHSRKRVFGPRPPIAAYDKRVNIGNAIQNPNVYYVSNQGSGSEFEDWLTTNFKSNLWNNNATSSLANRDDNDDHADLWSHTKTIYDPSPAGYLIPNAGVWHVIQKSWNSRYTHSDGSVGTKDVYKTINGVREKPAQRETWAGGNWPLSVFKSKINGAVIDPFNYKVWGKGNANNDAEALFFSSTGNRWWTNGWKPDGIGAGENFGKNVSYAWSNRSYTGRNAYGMALGLDTNRDSDLSDENDRYYVGGQFIGRRAMGRPVRCIREY